MKIDYVNYVDDFDADEHVFWLVVIDVPEEFIKKAKEVDGEDFESGCFSICIYHNEDEWDVERDGYKHELFYVCNDGDRIWFKYELTEEEKNVAIDLCKEYLDI